MSVNCDNPNSYATDAYIIRHYLNLKTYELRIHNFNKRLPWCVSLQSEKEEKNCVDVLVVRCLPWYRLNQISKVGRSQPQPTSIPTK